MESKQKYSSRGILVKDKYVFFYGGWLSQWSSSPFIVEKISYSCAEQWMMSEKALLFGDDVTRKQILETKDPKTMKLLGRKVANFDAKTWESKCMDIVIQGNLYKFSQNPKLLKALMETGDKVLVEASPYDRIWGIGLNISHPNITDQSYWKGTNLLGECLMKVRSQLQNKDSN